MSSSSLKEILAQPASELAYRALPICYALETLSLPLRQYGHLALKKIFGKINPADVRTKPKSIAEMINLTDALWFEVKIRKQRPGDVSRDGGFTGFVSRMLRGTDKDGGDLEETAMWWERNLKEWWEDGRLMK